MSQHRNTPFVGVSVTPDARDALKRLAIILSAQYGQRMSMSDAILEAEKILTSRKAAK